MNKISIAMATYNGALYIQEQLDSFLNQTVKPTELIVCDDGSSDQTIYLLGEFSKKAPFPVNIYINDMRLGYAANFSKALSLCSGEIIFLSDQDDVWFPNKIEKVVGLVDCNKKSAVIINDAIITNEKLESSGLTQRGQIINAGLPPNSFINGCCTAITRDILNLIMPIPEFVKGHDNWIHRFTEFLGCRIDIDEPLQLYRRHENHTSNIITSQNKKINKLSIVFSHLSEKTGDALFDRIILLDHIYKILKDEEKIKEININHKDIETGINYLVKERIVVIDRIEIRSQTLPIRIVRGFIFLISGNYKYFSGYKSYIRDVISI